MPKLSTTELESRIKKLQDQLQKAKANKRPTIQKVVAFMKKLDVSLEELQQHLQGAGPRSTPKKATRAVSSRAGTKVPVKYRDEQGNTWTGRGRSPAWIVAAEQQGRSRTEFLITS